MKRVIALAALVVGLALTPANAAYAAIGATIVSGLQVPDTAGVCTGDPAAQAAWTVTGDLTGCWYGDTIEFKNMSASGSILASGTEQFQGCLGTTCGTLYFSFTFTARFVGDVETHGRCHHPVVGGTGGFAGATGVISMHDLPNGCAEYHGRISLP